MIDDDRSLGPATYRAVKRGDRICCKQGTLETVAKRKYGSIIICKILRFMYHANEPSSDTSCWVGVPLTRKFTHYLFSRRGDNGKIMIPTDESRDYMEMVKLVLLNECIILLRRSDPQTGF